MDEIAATAGTSKTVFYRHFTDRAGLYTAVAERVDATIIRDLTRAAGDPAPDDARGRHPRVSIAAYLRLVEDDPRGLPLHRQRADRAARRTTPGGRRRRDDRPDRHPRRRPRGRDGRAPPRAIWSAPLPSPDGCGGWPSSAWCGRRPTRGSRPVAPPAGPSSDELADDLTALVWDGLSSVAVRGTGELTGSAAPPRAQRQPAGPVVVRPHRQHLVQLDLVALEPESRAGHVQAPDPRRALAHLGDALVPVVDEVAAPLGEGQRVVLAQVLLVETSSPTSCASVMIRPDPVSSPSGKT